MTTKKTANRHLRAEPQAVDNGRTQLRIGVITAYPPGRNSLNEFGFHLVKHLANETEVAQVLVFADETDAGVPATCCASVVPCGRRSRMPFC
jgi:hypothetical protein